MTRKDYVLIADALLSATNNAKSSAERTGILDTSLYIAEALKRDNARFDQERFLKATGLADVTR